MPLPAKRTPIAEIGGIGSLRGLHNAQNAACATAAALALGLSPAAIQAGLRSFPGLAHRMEEVGRRGNVLFVNDSKATNANSAAQALVCFDDIFWIAGGKPKTGGIESLRDFFPRIRKAYLIGEAAVEFAATLGDAVAHEITGTLDKAVAAAARDADTFDGARAGRAAVAGLRLVRSVSQFRGARRCVPQSRPGFARGRGNDAGRDGGAAAKSPCAAMTRVNKLDVWLAAMLLSPRRASVSMAVCIASFASLGVLVLVLIRGPKPSSWTAARRMPGACNSSAAMAGIRR